MQGNTRTLDRLVEPVVRTLTPEVAKVFCAAESTFEMADVDRGKIICLTMPHKFQTERRYVSTFLKLLLYHHVLNRFDKPRTERTGENLLILWADEGSLVVTDSDKPHLWAFRVEKDGSLSCQERYYHPLVIPTGRDKPGSDGMTIDKDGRLYVATAAGLQMFDPTGRLSGVIHKPQDKSLSNVCFGGPGLGFLYVTNGDKVYRRKTKTAGVLYRTKK